MGNMAASKLGAVRGWTVSMDGVVHDVEGLMASWFYCNYQGF